MGGHLFLLSSKRIPVIAELADLRGGIGRIPVAVGVGKIVQVAVGFTYRESWEEGKISLQMVG